MSCLRILFIVGENNLVHILLGPTNLETTAIYMNLVGEVELAEIVIAW